MATAALAAVLFAARPGRADEPSPPVREVEEPVLRASFSYERARGAELCPDEPAVREAVSRQLGAAAVGVAAAGAVAVGAAQPVSSRRIVLRVAARRPEPASARRGGEREIEGHIEVLDAAGKRLWENDIHAAHEDCATLVASLALSLRIAAAGLLRAGASPVPPPEGPGPAPPPIHVQGVSFLPMPPFPFDPESSFGRRGRGELETSIPAAFFISAGTATVIGAAPTLPLRLSVAVGYAWRHMSISIETRGLLPVTARVRGYLFHVSRWEGAFVACAHRGSFFACGQASVGGFSGRTTGAFRDTAAYFHTTGGVRLGGHLALTSNLSASAHIDGEGSFYLARVVFDNFANWEESPFQVTMGVVITGTFPSIQH